MPRTSYRTVLHISDYVHMATAERPVTVKDIVQYLTEDGYRVPRAKNIRRIIQEIMASDPCICKVVLEGSVGNEFAVYNNA